jgi:hypothetical protein
MARASVLEKMEEGGGLLGEDEVVAGWNVRRGSGAGGLNDVEEEGEH